MSTKMQQVIINLLKISDQINEQNTCVCECCGKPSHYKFMEVQADGVIFCNPCASTLTDFDRVVDMMLAVPEASQI